MQSLIIALLVVLSYYFYRAIRYIYIANKIPGPWNTWYLQGVGILIKMGRGSEVDRLKTMQHYLPYYAKLGKIFFGPFFCVLLHDPVWIQKIYNCPELLQKPHFYKFFGWGVGLVTAELNTWRPHRKHLNNAFNIRALHSFLPVFDVNAKKLVQQLEAEIGSGSFNFLEYMTKCTFDSICGEWFIHFMVEIIECNNRQFASS